MGGKEHCNIVQPWVLSFNLLFVFKWNKRIKWISGINIYSNTHQKSHPISTMCPNIIATQHQNELLPVIPSRRGELVTLDNPSLTESSILGRILNTATEEPMTSWSHKYYVLCFPHSCLMFHIEVGTIEQTAAYKRMGPLIPRGIILVEGEFSTGPAREGY